MTSPQRCGMVVTLRDDQVAQYCTLHGDVWPAVLTALKAAHIHRYTIYLRRPENLLFSHWEYHGKDWTADKAILDATPEVQKWLAICGPMQRGLSDAETGWNVMEEVFHLD